MKVYGITTSITHEGRLQTARVVVAATSQAKAVAAFQDAGMKNMTVNHYRQYGSQSWNPTENELALSRPGTVFYAVDGRSREFQPMVGGQ